MKSYDLTDGKEPISHAEIDYLKGLVRSLPPCPVIVQIGAATGVFTVAALEERNDIKTFYSVDCEECPQEFENVRKAGLDATKVIRLLGYSQEIGPHFPYQCDMLFVDGGHFNADKDIETWIKTGKVLPGGVIAFHDFIEDPPENNPGNVFDCVNAGMVGYEEIGRCERVIAFRNPSPT